MLASFPGSPLVPKKNPFLGRVWDRGYLHGIAVLIVSCPTSGGTVKTEERTNRNGSRERVSHYSMKWLQSFSIAKKNQQAEKSAKEHGHLVSPARDEKQPNNEATLLLSLNK